MIIYCLFFFRFWAVQKKSLVLQKCEFFFLWATFRLKGVKQEFWSLYINDSKSGLDGHWTWYFTIFPIPITYTINNRKTANCFISFYSCFNSSLGMTSFSQNIYAQIILYWMVQYNTFTTNWNFFPLWQPDPC